MFSYYNKVKNIFWENHEPKDIYDSNLPFLYLLSNMGFFSFKIIQQSGRKQIVLDKKRILIPCLNIIVLIYIFFDFSINKYQLIDKPILDENIYYAIILLQLFFQNLALVVLLLFNDKILVFQQKFYKNILEIDCNIDAFHTRNNLKVLLKYNIIILCYGSAHFGFLGVYCMRIGLKLWYAYVVPSLNISVITCFYIITVHIIRTRFKSLNTILLDCITHQSGSQEFSSKHGKIVSTSGNVSVTNNKLDIYVVTNIHNKLCDLVQELNEIFGIPISACIFSLLVFIVVHVFTRLVYLSYMENNLYDVNFYLGIWWNFLLQFLIFELSTECEKCNTQVMK